ncbi:MAG: hypothetical protein VKL42_13725 [Snowella sp.]|nr:hypothetical protein [Snowella sp.]
MYNNSLNFVNSLGKDRTFSTKNTGNFAQRYSPLLLIKGALQVFFFRLMVSNVKQT